MSVITITFENAKKYFILELLGENSNLRGFDCSVPEYNDYLERDAMRSRKDYIALTWLLTECSTKRIIAYMSLIYGCNQIIRYRKRLS